MNGREIHFCFLFVMLLANVQSQQELETECQPWGVRFNLGDYYMLGEGYQLGLTFNTNSSCEGFVLLIDNLNLKFTSTPLNYYEKQYSKPFNTFIQHVKIGGLALDKNRILVFQYQILLESSNITYSNKVRVASRDALHNYKAMVIGDWGLLDEQHKKIYYDVIPCMQQSLSNDSMILFIMFLGDLGYELSDKQGEVYVNTLTAIQKFTSRIPFMVTPGNHDTKYSYQLFHLSFFSPNYQNTSNYFYTFTIGNHVFLSFNPERDVYQNYPQRYKADILGMVKEYLIQNYSNTTNIIPFTHYSIYCSDPNQAQCANNPISLNSYAEVFQDFNVNLYFGAHIHVYQRSYPITKGKVGNFKNHSPNTSYGIYDNSSHTTYICEGAGGNNYFVYTTYYPLKDFTANRIINSGYGILELTYDNIRRLTYNHITAKDCAVSDHLQVTRQISIPKSSSNNIVGKIFLGIGLFLLIVGLVLFGFRYIQRLRKTDLLITSGGVATSTGSATGDAVQRQPEIKMEQFSQQL